MTDARGANTADLLRALKEHILALPEVAPDPAFLMCALCGDTGMEVRPRADGGQCAVRCGCFRARGARRRLERAGIPRRFAEATLAGYATAGCDPSLGLAARLARSVVEAFPLGGDGRGLLLTGTCGLGKTHLATGLLRELVMERGASGRWWDVGDLLVQLKRSFGRGGDEGAGAVRTEGSLLDELAAVDVLVLDELGAQRATEWSYDEVSLLIGQRYNAGRLLIATSNYPNLPPGVGGAKFETLGDRLGARMFSRLTEMCRPVELLGADYRMRRAG